MQNKKKPVVTSSPVTMAYGLFPFCVSDGVAMDTLWFRRSTGPTERDRAQRLAEAAEALQACPDVVWYNATLGAANAAPLHAVVQSLSDGLLVQNQSGRHPRAPSPWRGTWRTMHPPIIQCLVCVVL